MTVTENAQVKANIRKADAGLDLGEQAARLRQQAAGLRATSAQAARAALVMEISAELMARRGELADAVRAAREDVRTATAELEAATSVLRGITGELAECHRRAAIAASALAGKDMTKRISARSLQAAMAEEGKALEARANQQRGNVVTPAQLATQQARAECERTTAGLAALDHAIEHPLATTEGRHTKAWVADFTLSGRWIIVLAAGRPDDGLELAGYALAEQLFDGLVQSTGYADKYREQGRQAGHRERDHDFTHMQKAEPVKLAASAAADNSVPAWNGGA